MLDTEHTPMRFKSSSSRTMSRSGSFALMQAHTKESPLRAGRMSSRV